MTTYSVLIVDSNGHSRDLLDRMLRSVAGAEGIVPDIRRASGGVPAIAMVIDTMPDIVFIAVQMPRMDGWDTAQQIRRMGEPPNKQPMIVMMTTSTPDAERMEEVGALELELPIAREALAKTIRILKGMQQRTGPPLVS